MGMKKVPIQLIAFVFGTVLFVSAPFLVHAQETVAVEEPQASPVAVTNPVVKTQIQELKEQYRVQLLAYRDNERQYTIAKEQYLQLKTLRSLEEAVQSARKVMLSRIQVLTTYISLLKQTLLETKGIDLKLKGEHIATIDLLLDEMTAHRRAIEKAADRTDVNALVDSFDKLQPEIETSAFKSLTLITYGNMRSVYDKTLSVRNEVQQNIEQNETDALKLSEKKRGFEEISRNLQDVETALGKVEEQMTDEKAEFSSTTYSEVVTGLSSVYGGLSRSISYLHESIQ